MSDELFSELYREWSATGDPTLYLKLKQLCERTNFADPRCHQIDITRRKRQAAGDVLRAFQNWYIAIGFDGDISEPIPIEPHYKWDPRGSTDPAYSIGLRATHNEYFTGSAFKNLIETLLDIYHGRKVTSKAPLSDMIKWAIKYLTEMEIELWPPGDPIAYQEATEIALAQLQELQAVEDYFQSPQEIIVQQAQDLIHRIGQTVDTLVQQCADLETLSDGNQIKVINDMIWQQIFGGHGIGGMAAATRQAFGDIEPPGYADRSLLA